MKHWLFLLLLFPLFPTSATAQIFAPATIYPAGNAAGSTVVYDVAVGDVNGDSYPDIVAANILAGTVGVFLNAQNGTFAPVVRYAAGPINCMPQSVALGDVNVDGYPDIVTANYQTGSAGVLLNNHNGTFAAVTAYAVGAVGCQPQGVAVGNVNGDAYPDIVVANSGVGQVGILINNQSGGFNAVAAYSAGMGSLPIGVAIGNVNGDSYPDIVVNNYTSSNGSGQVGVLLGRSTGSFPLVVGYSTGGSTDNVALGDMNADGYPDLLAALPGSSAVSIFTNNQNGTFAAAVPYATGSGTFPQEVVAGDMNGDGYLDLVVANTQVGLAGVLLNKRNGTFWPVTNFVTGPNSGPIAIAVSDVNKDGRLDIITADGSGNSVSVLLNTTVLATKSALFTHTQLSLAPNPTADTSNLTATGLPAEVQQLHATLTDAVGRSVQHQTIATSQGAAQLTFSTASLAPGIYLIQLTGLDTQGATLGRLPVQQLAVQP